MSIAQTNVNFFDSASGRSRRRAHAPRPQISSDTVGGLDLRDRRSRVGDHRSNRADVTA
jgi:hypothetical protein